MIQFRRLVATALIVSTASFSVPQPAYAAMLSTGAAVARIALPLRAQREIAIELQLRPDAESGAVVGFAVRHERAAAFDLRAEDAELAVERKRAEHRPGGDPHSFPGVAFDAARRRGRFAKIMETGFDREDAVQLEAGEDLQRAIGVVARGGGNGTSRPPMRLTERQTGVEVIAAGRTLLCLRRRRGAQRSGERRHP